MTALHPPASPALATPTGAWRKLSAAMTAEIPAIGGRPVPVACDPAGQFEGLRKFPGADLAGQVEALRKQGSHVEVITPDADSRAALGTNLMDPATRIPAARAGFAQGKQEATRVTFL